MKRFRQTAGKHGRLPLFCFSCIASATGSYRSVVASALAAIRKTQSSPYCLPGCLPEIAFSFLQNCGAEIIVKKGAPPPCISICQVLRCHSKSELLIEERAESPFFCRNEGQEIYEPQRV